MAKKRTKEDNTIRVALIGAGATIIVALITGLFSLAQRQPTSTAVAVQTLEPSLPSASSTQSYDVGEDFRGDCINIGHWEPFAHIITPENLLKEVTPILPPYSSGCLDKDAQDVWGFHVANGSLVIHKQLGQERDATFYGLSTPLPQRSIIQLSVMVNRPTTGTMLFGVLSKPLANPLKVSEFTVAAYPDDRIELAQGLTALNRYSFASDRSYTIRFEILPDSLQVNINDGEQIFTTTGKFVSSHFMIGYLLGPGQNIDATVNGVSVRRK